MPVFAPYSRFWDILSCFIGKYQPENLVLWAHLLRTFLSRDEATLYEGVSVRPLDGWSARRSVRP